jgi:hypothetical protein
MSPIGLLMLVVAASFHHLTVEDRGDVLAVRFGPLPLFLRTVRYADIQAVEIGRTLRLDGWGIHYSLRGGWVWNLWGRDCVVVRFRDGRTLRIGTDDDRTTGYEGEQLLALFRNFQPKMLELAKWHVDVVEFLTTKISERFGVQFDATDFREKVERMTSKYVWDEDDLPDWSRSMAAIRRAAAENPMIGEFIDRIAEKWDSDVQTQIDALRAKHEQATEKWAVASREQAPVLKRVCDGLETQMAELRAKLIRQNFVEMEAILAESRSLCAQVESVAKVLRTGNGYAKAEALKQLVKEIRLEFAPKKSHKSKSRLVLWKFVLCDSNEVRATACRDPRTGRPAPGGS